MPIRGVAGDGSTESVPGALVTLTTNFPLPPSETRSVRVTYSAQAVTDGLTEAEPGVAILTLFPGSFEEGRTYSVRVLPPLDSEFASLFAGELSVGTGHGATVLEALELARRIPVSGQIVTHAGDPLRGAPVSLAASSAVGWRLGEQAAASGFESLQFPTDTTSEDGSFLVWLDPSLVGEAAAYDIDVSPPTFADAPPWTFEAALTGNDGPAVRSRPAAAPGGLLRTRASPRSRLGRGRRRGAPPLSASRPEHLHPTRHFLEPVRAPSQAPRYLGERRGGARPPDPPGSLRFSRCSGRPARKV